MLFSEIPQCMKIRLILAVTNMPIWCLWNRLQNVLENCLSFILHCQLRKHRGSWETEMTKNYSIQIKKRYFLLSVNKGLLLHWISLIEPWSVFIYFLLLSLCPDYVGVLVLALQEHQSHATAEQPSPPIKEPPQQQIIPPIMSLCCLPAQGFSSPRTYRVGSLPLSIWAGATCF